LDPAELWWLLDAHWSSSAHFGSLTGAEVAEMWSEGRAEGIF
jgi:hypothetical protein